MPLLATVRAHTGKEKRTSAYKTTHSTPHPYTHYEDRTYCQNGTTQLCQIPKSNAGNRGNLTDQA